MLFRSGGDAQIAAAAAGKKLADKSWYPDVMLKAGAIDRTGNGPNGYMAEIGLRCEQSANPGRLCRDPSA